MFHPLRRAALLLLAALPACLPTPRTAPAPAAPTIEAIFDDTAFAHAHWGVVVQSLQTGEPLYEQNRDKFFMPASNMKLITGAAALDALGPEYRYRTRIVAAGPIEDGVLRGDLKIIGAGDPAISGRFTEGDPRAIFRAWADSLRAHGIERVAGAIIGVDTVFDDRNWGRGWMWDDLLSYYSAEFSGLTFNEGAIEVTVFPGSGVGAPGIIVLDPPTGYVRVQNRTTTVPAGTPPRIRFEREVTGAGLIVSGEIPADSTVVQRDLAVRGSSSFFVSMLRQVLREEGIMVEGPALVLGDRIGFEEESALLGTPEPLFIHLSPPMREILPALLKPSQNQIAEILLKTLGRELRGEGSSEAGTEVVDSLLVVWDLDPSELLMADGSGLSRYNYVTPDLLIALLERMTRSPHWELWYASLPIAGIDGTLRNRLRGTVAEGNVHAKTGTLANTRALSGYLTTADGERLIFSMIANNHAQSSRDADRLIDAALVRLIGATESGAGIASSGADRRP